MTIPTATYRLQFRNGMDFGGAARAVPYLRELGASHLYASPIFTAPAGSTHGYDVADHNEVDPALGGREGFERLADELRAAGLGLILDIVPNHMAASLENPWWRSVVQWGEGSPFANHFDIDWTRRLTLPLLGRPYGEVLAANELRLEVDAAVGTLAVRYRDTVLPLSPTSWDAVLPALRHPLARRLAEAGRSATARQADRLHAIVRELVACPEAGALRDELAALSSDRSLLDALHRRQPWELIFWKEARRNLSYRRFFEVTGLVGVRVEDGQVFDDVHRLTLELVRSGTVQGLRIDHVDGLADPSGYLRRLREEAGAECYVVVEKILGEGEELRRDWPVQGTTGYEFIDAMADVLIDADGVAALSRRYREMTGSRSSEELRRAAKTQVLNVNFEGEVQRLARLLADCEGPDVPGPEEVREALVQLIAAMPVYRIYGDSREDRAVMRAALTVAKAEAPHLAGVLEFLRAALTGDHPAARTGGGSLARERFQQLTGPAMAKGVEDTLFYRDHRFIALNEVGSDPDRPPPVLSRFHKAMAARAWTAPHGLSATSTHDTKRGEDARARLMVLSEMADKWSAQVAQWRERRSTVVTRLPGGLAPEPELEWMIFQALAGCWPADRGEQASEAFRERILAYLEKALREAKLRTTWTEIDETYERAVKRYATALLADRVFAEDMNRIMRRLRVAGWVNSLTQTLVKFAAPGVPDIYQGSEAGDFSLVDPDNRRPVDFDGLARMLRDGPSGRFDFPALKQRLVARLSAIRRAHPSLFAGGSYLPVVAVGPMRRTLVAFARTRGNRALVVAAPRLTLALLDADGASGAEAWEGTALAMPAGWEVGSGREVISGRQIALEPQLDLASLFADAGLAALMVERP